MTSLRPARGAQSWGWLVLWAALSLPSLALPLIDLNQPELGSAILQPLLLHPNQGWQQTPWSWWSTAWVHGSLPHLVHNVVGLSVIIGMAHWTQLPAHALQAWVLAWPLTHIGMLGRPELSTYIGMSGVLHAGAAVLALNQMLSPTRPGFRWTGLILGIGLVAKVLMENPWNTVLFLSDSSAINVAPWAHFCGLMAGLICGGVLWLIHKRIPPNSSVISRH